MRCSKYVVNPSFSQKSFQVAFVTRLPDHECASSCEISETSDLSPAITVGVRNVSRGFSIPPYGKLGGSTSRSYRPHRYGPYNSSAVLIMFGVSLNSRAAASI